MSVIFKSHSVHAYVYNIHAQHFTKHYARLTPYRWYSYFLISVKF